MISVHPIKGGAAAGEYYLDRTSGCEQQLEPAEGYYTNEHETAGRWLGRGAAALGLEGGLEAEGEAQFKELLAGRLHGEQIAKAVMRNEPVMERVLTKDVRVAGYDVTLSAPKSISTIAAMTDQVVTQSLQRAHNLATHDAMGLLEQLSARAARGHHGDGQSAPRIATDGFIACGMIKQDADHVVIATTGGGGHIYTLDMNSETLTDRGVLGAASWHSFNMTADGTRGFGSSPLSDEVIVFDLTTTPVTKLGSIVFDQVPGVGHNQPDAFGGGEAIYGNVLPVGLRAAGNVAIVNAHNLEVRSLVNLEPPAPFNPMTCGPVGPPTGTGGCAIHGVTPRPRR